MIEKENIIGSSLNDIIVWSKQNSLSTNVLKTKYIIFSKKRLSSIHKLNTHQSTIVTNDKLLQRVNNVRILGLNFDEHFTWDSHLNNISSCYGKLSVLKKLKN